MQCKGEMLQIEIPLDDFACLLHWPHFKRGNRGGRPSCQLPGCYCKSKPESSMLPQCFAILETHGCRPSFRLTPVKCVFASIMFSDWTICLLRPLMHVARLLKSKSGTDCFSQHTTWKCISEDAAKKFLGPVGTNAAAKCSAVDKGAFSFGYSTPSEPNLQIS